MKLPPKFSSIELFRSKASQLLTFIERELETFDTLDINTKSSDNHSFLFSLVSKLKALDKSHIVTYLKSNRDAYSQILVDPKLKPEADIMNGRIFAKRGAPKKTQDDRGERRRRQSFAAVSYGNLEMILTTESILSMSDLNIIFSLNAFFLPYCDSDKQRTMYEHFFDVFLKVVNEKHPESSGFHLMQESIMIIQKISEAWMNSIEVILEMINLGYIRIKTHEAMMNPNMKSSFNSECKDEMEIRFYEVLKTIASPKKVFRMIGTGSLTDANSKHMGLNTLVLRPDTCFDKLGNQIEVLRMAREVDLITIEISISIITPFVSEFPEFVSQLRLYMETFKIFSDSLFEKGGLFQGFVTIFGTMCKNLETVEKGLNVVLDSPRRSPKDSKWFSPRKTGSSPREAKE